MAERMPPEISPNVQTTFFMTSAPREKVSGAEPRLRPPRSPSPERMILAGKTRQSSFRATASRQQSGRLGDLHRLRPAARVELLEEPAGVGLDRVLADEEAGGDLAIAEALGDEDQDLELARRDPEGVEARLI